MTSASVPCAASSSAAAIVSLTMAPQLISVTSRPCRRTKATSSGNASPVSSTWPFAARDMGEHGFRALRMMLGRTNAPAVRGAQHHGAAQPPLGSVAQPRGVVHELIDAGIKKAHELDLAHGPQPLRRHADAKPADQQLGERGVDHPLGAE